MLYLEHCIISINSSNLIFKYFQKNIFYIFSSFENMEKRVFRTFCSLDANVPFFIIFFKNLTFQRRPKSLVWSKGISMFCKKLNYSVTKTRF